MHTPTIHYVLTIYEHQHLQLALIPHKDQLVADGISGEVTLLLRSSTSRLALLLFNF